MKITLILGLSFLLAFFADNLYAQGEPAAEIRAVWLATNWNLDWPAEGKSPEEQKRQMRIILDKLRQANFNTVLFQVRVRGDVFYQSRIEPWSTYFKKNAPIGSLAAYDPLAFVIKECHARGMECHAWVVTFPVGSQKQVNEQKNNSVVSRYPHLCKFHNGEWYLDPGVPQTKNYIVSIVDEIVNNYNIDGIHFDYIRYPENAKSFPDQDTYRKYGSGKNLAQWRMDNITSLVSSIYDRIKSKKPWVQVSCSPVGRYRDLNPMKGTWTALGSVHQDAGRWMREGKMDAVYPMLYYKEADFGNYVQDWLQTSNGRFVVPGLGAYRLLKTDGDWSVDEITRQINTAKNINAAGTAFYRAGNVLDNTKNILEVLKENYYSYPAKIPPMKWLSNKAPNPPKNIKVYRNTDGRISIEWESSDTSSPQTYTIYESRINSCDVNNPRGIVATGVRGNKMYLNAPYDDTGIYFSITASDRFHNESRPATPVYLILSRDLKK